MGKRNNEDPEYLKKKKKNKLKKKLKKIPADVSSPPSSPLSSSPTRRQSTETPAPPSPIIPALNDLDQDPITEDNVPEELLQALGTEGEDTTVLGEAIRPELAQRWSKIMQTGLGKESRDIIIKKYPTPVNFPRAVAPLMNAEISASFSEVTLKRDKRICYRQNITGKLMTCIGKSLSKILMANINRKEIVEEMSDAAKLAADIYYQDSSSRRFFALAGVNKVVQDAVKTTTPDKTLFGMDCAEKIKAAQTIQKTGSLIKQTEKKSFKTGTSKTQLNWRGPPQYQQQQRARGGHQYRQHQHQRQPRPDQTRKTQKKTPYSPKPKYRR